MSYCKEEGKDQVIFATKEDLSSPSNAIINMEEDEEDQQQGLILPNGEINWECPCLGGMASGPCGTDFREAFSCFHYSEAEPKGSDCYDAFLTMQECMSQYPELYPPARPPTESAELTQLSGVPDDMGLGEEKDSESKSEESPSEQPSRAQS